MVALDLATCLLGALVLHDHAELQPRIVGQTLLKDKAEVKDEFDLADFIVGTKHLIDC